MNRRSFFKSLSVISAAAMGCPGVFIPKFEPVKWKVHKPVWVENPEWVTAKYEVYFIDHPALFDPVILRELEPQGRGVY